MRNAGFVFSAAVILAAGCSSTNPVDESSIAPAPASAKAANFEVIEASAPVQDSNADALLDERWKVLSLAEQKKAFLLEQYMDNAKDLRQRAQLQNAYDEVQKALTLDGDFLPAKKLRAELGTLLGKMPDIAGQLVNNGAEAHSIKTQQLFLRGKENLDRGKVALARGDYDEAIAEFTLCRNHIRWAPAIDWKGMDAEAEALLEGAKASRSSAQADELEAKRRAAYESLKADSAAAAAREAEVTMTLIADAAAAFKFADYETAMAKADMALKNSPRNAKAQDIRDAAYRAKRESASQEYLRTKNEMYDAWRLDMLIMSTPENDVYTPPSPETWAEITNLRKARPGLDLTETISQNELALRAKLENTSIQRIEIPETDSLTEVFNVIKTQTGLPIHVDGQAENAALDEAVVFAYEFPYSINAIDLINMVTQQAGEQVTWTIRHDVVLVTTKENARGDLRMQSHDVNSLILGLTDFMGPRIDGIRLLDNMEDDDGGGPFGGIGERKLLIEPDDLATLVTENVAVGQWEDDGVSIEIFEGHMIVIHTLEVQRQVQQFLEDLGRFNTSLVTIETKFLTIGDNWIQELGVEWRGIDNPGDPFTDLDDVNSGLEDKAGLGLDNGGTGDGASPPSAGFFFDDGQDGDFKGSVSNVFNNPLGAALSTIGGLTSQWSLIDDSQLSLIFSAVEKDSQVELINDQTLSVFNTARAYVTVINQVAYIQDFEVEAFQFQVAADPQINVVQEGIVLDVRPTINHDRKSITLEVQPTVAEIVSLTDFTTSLGGSTTPVSLQLPELSVRSIFTTVEVPDGGSILLGGLSKIRNVERRAEVPWLGKIPGLGFLFKEEGYSDEKQSLMILITARITDITEGLQ